MTRKKTGRKNLSRIETWKGRRFRVTRNSRGRFVKVHKIRRYTRGRTARRKWKTQVGRRRWRVGVQVTFPIQKRIILEGRWRGEKKEVSRRGSGRELYNFVRNEMINANRHEGWDERPQVFS